MDNLELVKDMKLLLGMVSELRLEVDSLRKELQLKDGKDDMLTLKEACDYLRIGRTAMYRRLDNGEISFAVKRGKSYLFPKDKLRSYASGII